MVAGLHDAPAHIGQRDAADHGAVQLAENDEGIGAVGGDVLGIAAQPAPEAGTGQVVGGPDRLPRRQIFAAIFAQIRPLQESDICGARSNRPLPRGASAGVPVDGKRNRAM